MARDRIPLSGTWDFQLKGESDWRPVVVPGCWEDLGIDKQLVGPAVFRRTFDVPRAFGGRRVWLRFEGVSHNSTVRVNGREVGTHTGAWDAFDVEITPAVKPGQRAELLVEVEKPATLSKGPESPHLPGRFPLKQTLCGFLPYVWGHMFGGIWQDVWLYATGGTVIDDLLVRGDMHGAVRITAKLSADVQWRIALRDGNDRTIATTNGRGANVEAELQIDEARPWSPDNPHLYTTTLEIDDGRGGDAGAGDARAVRFGLRTQSVANDGSTILLNAQPIYPRMILSWGWYPESLHANPGPQRVRADFQRMRAMGYNGVKLCLWYPPQYYFDLADETGMLLWLELPMWMPEPSESFRHQLFEEYPRLMKQARQHPSVVLVTLGCELDKSIGPAILAPLFQLAKQHFPDALVRDNSGSGDAYGGLLDEHAEFYDYHFYSDPHFFTPLLDHFTPRWRPRQPWVFGEFCDADTFRDLRHLYTAHADRKPWWTTRHERLNPQGARWQYDVVEQEARLKSIGYWDRGDELVRISNRQALLHRKWTLETVRAYREIGGYVVTGETDTPISTAGMWDDLGQVKFAADAFRAFNDDLVVLLGWDKRRAWVHGGDRAAYWDAWSYLPGQTIRAHVIVSNYSRAGGRATFEWSVQGDGVNAHGKGESSRDVARADVREIGVVRLDVPPVQRPLDVVLEVRVKLADREARNAWKLWLFPPNAWKDLRAVALLDPSGRLADLRESTQALETQLGAARVAITTAWSDELDAYVSRGGRAVLLQGEGTTGPVPTVAMPFWRESIRLVEPHPAWRDFPLDGGLVGLQFSGCATDRALDTSNLKHPAEPILRRLDARTSRLHDYATDIAWGHGRLIVSTLRVEGGHGTQPAGITRSTAARHLLWCWARHLLESA
jgi:hypothetical protein